jgi:hypothetical protein
VHLVVEPLPEILAAIWPVVLAEPFDSIVNEAAAVARAILPGEEAFAGLLPVLIAPFKLDPACPLLEPLPVLLTVFESAAIFRPSDFVQFTASTQLPIAHRTDVYIAVAENYSPLPLNLALYKIPFHNLIFAVDMQTLANAVPLMIDGSDPDLAVIHLDRLSLRRAIQWNLKRSKGLVLCPGLLLHILQYFAYIYLVTDPWRW